VALFRIRARVLDLLGEQQIANCPTAISELFKNAYDAYAERAMLDVYPENDCAALWDDGQGMSEEDIHERWLIVGAADKGGATASRPPAGTVKRPVQGEKGIGRLAISTLGDSLLLISKSVLPDSKNDPYVAVFVNWNIAHNDRLMLEDIEVPVITFSSIEDLESGIVDDMIEEFRKPLEMEENQAVWEGQKHSDLRSKIIEQLDTFTVDMRAIKRTGFAKLAHGTFFFIKHLHDDIPQYVRRPERDQEDEAPNTELVQLLTNFQNNFEKGPASGKGKNKSLPFYVDVRRWDEDAKVLTSAFTEWESIEPDDLEFHDHHMDVDFDDWGQYRGMLQVFDSTYEIRSPRPQPKRQLTCGPFRLRLWYVQGVQKESRLDSDHWHLMHQKLERFGGLMIYRDDLRVLPYGRPELDWLYFEERRSRGAGRYFFSYRRMFGYVAITREANPRLTDKAGREGLIANTAFRQLRQCLIGFFSKIALRYFGKTDSYLEAKERITKQAELIEEEQKRSSERRKRLYEEAARRLDMLENVKSTIEDLINRGVAELESLVELDTPKAAMCHFNEQLAEYENQIRLEIPEDLSLGRDTELKKVLFDHQNAYAHFLKACENARTSFSRIISERFEEARRVAARRMMLREGFQKARHQFDAASKQVFQALGKGVSELRGSVESISKDYFKRIEDALLVSTSSKTLEEALSSDSGDPLLIIGEVERAAADSITAMKGLQERIDSYIGGFFTKSRDILVAAQAGEIEELRAQVDRNLELVQLGLSVEIIDHDLNRLYRGIRASLARMKQLVRRAPNALSLADELAAAFQHLEQRYKLMSPLYRGSYRVKSEINGRRIQEYVQDFLSRLLDSTGVKVSVSDSFSKFQIMEVPAIVLPVFVNIVDNAIYWLREQPEPMVLLDLKDGVVTICDNGPGIHETQLEEIFEPFFTTKPNGRGLGLYVARANLERYGHKIWATNVPEYRTLKGACLCISFRSDSIMGDGK